MWTTCAISCYLLTHDTLFEDVFLERIFSTPFDETVHIEFEGGYPIEFFGIKSPVNARELAENQPISESLSISPGSI